MSKPTILMREKDNEHLFYSPIGKNYVLIQLANILNKIIGTNGENEAELYCPALSRKLLE